MSTASEEAVPKLEEILPSHEIQAEQPLNAAHLE